MRRTVLLLLAVLAGCTTTPPPPPVSEASSPADAGPPAPAFTGVDTAAMDTAVKPGDDFYGFANGTYLRTTEIPADRSGTGAFLKVFNVVEQRTKAIAEADTGKVGTMYRSFMDEAGIEARGLTPLKALLDEVAAVKDRAALSRYLGSQVRADVDVINCTSPATSRPMGLWVEQDLNDPSRNAAYLLQGGLGLPDRVYYLEGGRNVAIRDAYQTYLATLFELAGEKDAAGKAKRVLALETKIARAHASREDTGDVAKGNNPVTRAELEKRARGLDWKGFLAAAGLDGQERFILWQPSGITGFAALVASEPVGTWKEYLVARLLDRSAPYLPKGFADASFAFRATTLAGIPQQPARWKRALSVVDGSVGMLMGQLYVDRHFSPESKAEINTMVENIRAAFDRRVAGLDWMSQATKDRARAKLKVLVVGIGYPDSWPDFSGLTVEEGDVLGNLERASLHERQREIAKLGKTPDRGEWCMLPHAVNAVNLPVRNALNFPAGILEPPFYDKDATLAVKYAAIGSVIGHEISHSFDDSGSMFDEEGRVKNWWTAEDLQHFKAAGQKLVEQYDGYRPFPDAAVSGKLTLGENIADLAGVGAAYDAWKASLGGQPAPVVQGLTGPQQFFVSYAQVWQSKLREPALRQRLVTDGHAPGQYRAVTVRNLDDWYEAFGVKEGDRQYLAPPDRVRVW